MPHPLDEKARPILFDTYWKGGWIPAPQTDPADLAYAQAQGLMFAPVTRSHEECLSQRLECRDRLPARTAGRAFVARLACAGVPRAADLDRPARGKSDWRYASDWRGEDGYCAETAAAWFGPWLA